MVLKYGSKLVCVRYRYDEVTFKRYKTVELIEDEIPWRPKLKADTVVEVQVKWGEKEGPSIRQQVTRLVVNMD